MSMQLKGTVLFNHASMLPPTDINRGSISSAVVISFSSILILSCDILLLLQILMLVARAACLVPFYTFSLPLMRKEVRRKSA